MHDIELPIRALGSARGHNRYRRASERLLRAPRIPMSSCSRQYPGQARKYTLALHKRSRRLVHHKLGLHHRNRITVMSIASVVLRYVRGNESCVITFEHLKLYVFYILLYLLYYACVRSGSGPVWVHSDINCIMHRYSLFSWSKIKVYIVAHMR